MLLPMFLWWCKRNLILMSVTETNRKCLMTNNRKLIWSVEKSKVELIHLLWSHVCFEPGFIFTEVVWGYFSGFNLCFDFCHVHTDRVKSTPRHTSNKHSFTHWFSGLNQSATDGTAGCLHWLGDFLQLFFKDPRLLSFWSQHSEASECILTVVMPSWGKRRSRLRAAEQLSVQKWLPLIQPVKTTSESACSRRLMGLKDKKHSCDK